MTFGTSPVARWSLYAASGRHIVELLKDLLHARRASRPASLEGHYRRVERIESMHGRGALCFSRHSWPVIVYGGLEIVCERGPHGHGLGLLALRVAKERRGRAGLVRHGGLRVVELLPHDDDGESEQDGVDDAYGREFESGDLVVPGQLGDADTLMDQGLRAHRQSGGNPHDHHDEKP